jgi:hypothetical protein
LGGGRWVIGSSFETVISPIISSHPTPCPLPQSWRLSRKGKKLSFRTSDAVHREIRNLEKLCDFKISWIPARAPLHGAWPG